VLCSFTPKSGSLALDCRLKFGMVGSVVRWKAGILPLAGSCCSFTALRMHDATPVSLGGQFSGVIDTIDSCLNASVLEWNLHRGHMTRVDEHPGITRRQQHNHIWGAAAMCSCKGAALVLSMPEKIGDHQAERCFR
jgi:hypothetical protein